MKGQEHNKGTLKELKVNIEEKVVDDFEIMARNTGIPIIFGVLTTDTMQQALERAGIKNNLGWSYALQALEMGSLMKALS